MKNVIMQGSFNETSAPTTSSSAMEWATWLTLITARSPSDSSLRSLVIIRGSRNLYADYYMKTSRSQLYPKQRRWWMILMMLSFTWLVYEKVMCAPDHYHSTTWDGAKRCVHILLLRNPLMCASSVMIFLHLICIMLGLDMLQYVLGQCYLSLSDLCIGNTCIHELYVGCSFCAHHNP